MVRVMSEQYECESSVKGYCEKNYKINTAHADRWFHIAGYKLVDVGGDLQNADW